MTQDTMMPNRPRSKTSHIPRRYAHHEKRRGVFQCEGETNEHRRCINEVSGGCLCYRHRDTGRNCSQFVRPGASQFVSTRVSLAPSRQALASLQRAEMTMKAAQAASERTMAIAQAAAHVQAFASAGWGDQARDYFTEKMGEKVWSQLESRRHFNQCKKFAQVAAGIEACYTQLEHVDQVDQKIPAIRALLQPLNPLAHYAGQAVIALRTAGIAICVVRGLRILDCACFKAMVDDSSIGPQAITWVLNDVINGGFAAR